MVVGLFGPWSLPVAGSSIGWTAPDQGQPLAPAAYLSEDIDPLTGELRSLTSGVHPVDAMVVEQIRVQRGTGASVMQDGNLLRKIDMNNAQTPISLSQEAHRIFDPMVSKGYVTIVSIDTQAGEDQGDMAALAVSYRNRLLGSGSVPQTVTIL